METIYLAGGINGLSDADAKDWRELVKEQLATYYTLLDPMRRDYRGKEADNVFDIVNGDCLDIRNSDTMLAMCEKPSWGTAMEIRFAHENGIPVVGVCSSPSPSPWLRYHCIEIFKTLDEAINYFRINVPAGIYLI